MQLIHHDLFCGIGTAFDASAAAGLTPSRGCEIDDLGKKVVHRFHPKVRLDSDYRSTSWASWRPTSTQLSLVTGSPACQTLAVGGKQNLADARTMQTRQFVSIGAMAGASIIGMEQVSELDTLDHVHGLLTDLNNYGGNASGLCHAGQVYSATLTGWGPLF